LIAVTCLLLRLKAAASGAFTCKAHVVPTHLRFDSLFSGVALSYYYHYHRPRFDALAQRFSRVFILVGFCLLLPAFIFDQSSTRYLYTFGYTEFYIGCGLILVGFLGRPFRQNPLTQCIAFLGSRSYSIYLWHGPVWFLASERFSPGKDFINWYGWNITFMGGALLVGVAMAALLEYPVLRLRDRWFPSRIKDGQPAVAASEDHDSYVPSAISVGPEAVRA